MTFNLTHEDVKEMKDAIRTIQSHLNTLFSEQQQRDQLPQDAMAISINLGKLAHKIDKIRT